MDRSELRALVEASLRRLLPPASSSENRDSRASASPTGPDLTAAVTAARHRGVIELPPGAVLTPQARDAAERFGVTLKVAPAAEPDAGPAPIDARGAIAIGSDHGGFALKTILKGVLSAHDLRVMDLGTHSTESCDYPDFAAAVARAVALGEASFGVLIDGAGIGSCMAANKVPGILAATCHSVATAKNSREHNGANVLCLGAGSLDAEQARAVLEAWITTPFAGGRHGRRVDKIKAIEKAFTR